MRLSHLALAGSAALLLSACGGGGPFDRTRPDEFAVSRNAPLVVPPDFALTPPAPGQADVGSDVRAQALQALFGGPQARSAQTLAGRTVRMTVWSRKLLPCCTSSDT